jgi:phage-related protein
MKSIKSKGIKSRWKSAVMILSTALCVGAMAPQAFAQGVPANPDMNWGQISAFDAYLDGHPIMAQQLYADPQLVRNQNYLAQHEDLRSFFYRNPDVAREITQTPDWFMQREAQFQQLERTHSGINRVELDNLDRYLDEHPEVARELAARPGLADNRQYLAQHPELQSFLVRHPGVWSQFQNNPKWLMVREHHFERQTESGYGHTYWDGGHRETDYQRRMVEQREREAARNREHTNRGMPGGDYRHMHPEVVRNVNPNPDLVRRPVTAVNVPPPRIAPAPTHTEMFAESGPGQHGHEMPGRTPVGPHHLVR